MTHGNLQLAPQDSLDKRVITISRSQPVDPRDDVDDPLLVSVVRRRGLLLAICIGLSGLAGLLVAGRFSMPKAITTGQLRYVALPPSLQKIYQAPQTPELVEIMRSNESMLELAGRTGLQSDPKELREQFKITASRYSNIIDVELRWNEGAQAIELVNTLMRVACEVTAASRKETLSQYRVETELQYEAAHQRVASLRDQLVQLRQERASRLEGDETLGSEAERLLNQLTRAEEALDDLTLRRASLNRQLATLRSDVETLRNQVRQELLLGRRQQMETRQRLFNANSERHAELTQIGRDLDQFEESNQGFDDLTWRAKLETIGATVLGELDAASLAAVTVLERQLTFKEAKIQQIEFDLLPIEGELSLLENRRASLERRLSDAVGSVDLNSTAEEEAEAQLDEAVLGRSRLLEQLNGIRRGETTEFSEMTVLTPASWQTTETSQGKAKLFVFTCGGCLIALVLPIFALEHFFPSGDPADQAARALGIPRVSRGTFLMPASNRDPKRPPSINSEGIRLLALRIQQSAHGPGSLVLFSGLDHDRSSIPTISHLAECLARREERVLMIDACDRPRDSQHRSTNEDIVSSVIARVPSNGRAASNGNRQSSSGRQIESEFASHASPVERPESVGLADFLQGLELGLDDLIRPTSIAGVDIIPCGSRRFPREGLAASRLTTLLEVCRQRYTMILVAGPSTNQPSDLQMLSARADGILLTVLPTGRLSGSGAEVVRDLLDLGALVIGIVS